jgi:hypothetical protein
VGPADTSITSLPGTGAPTEFLIEIAYLLDSSEHLQHPMMMYERKDFDNCTVIRDRKKQKGAENRER